MRSKPVLEEFGQPRTTPEECKVALATAKRFTFALYLSRPQRSRSNRKPLLLQTSRPNSQHADAMILVFFHEPCRLSKPWLRLFCAITHCAKTRSKCDCKLPILDCRLWAVIADVASRKSASANSRSTI